MEYTKLGQTDIEISRICIGGMSFGKVFPDFHQWVIDQPATQAVIKEALNQGINFIGYCPWAFADLVSTHNGFAKRYGFVRVDQDDTGTGTFDRTPKDSFWWYSRLIETNGQTLHKA